MQSIVFLGFAKDLFNFSCGMGSLGNALSACGQHGSINREQDEQEYVKLYI
jgi:hypothetical protein